MLTPLIIAKTTVECYAGERVKNYGVNISIFPHTVRDVNNKNSLYFRLFCERIIRKGMIYSNMPGRLLTFDSFSLEV